jgi:parvulin-like peptidyl-prolyl isomerase
MAEVINSIEEQSIVRNHRFQIWMVTIVLAASALAAPAKGQPQTRGAPDADVQETNAKEKAADTAAQVPPQATVLTIDGICPGQDSNTAKPTAACKTVLTRSEFENLAAVVDPAMSPKQKAQFAGSYARYLMFAHAARKQGLDKDPRFQRLVELTELQLLAQTYMQALQDKSKQILPEEVDKFYRENPKLFEVGNFLRIYVPADARTVEDASEDSKHTDLKAAAEQIRTRAAGGEDFARLQKEAFQAAHMESPPSVNIEKLSRGRLAPELQVVFDLKPGEVSPLLSSSNAYFIYKLVSKETQPLEAVKEQVERTMQSRRMDEAMKNAVGSAKVLLNEEYFKKSKEGDEEGER